MVTSAASVQDRTRRDPDAPNRGRKRPAWAGVLLATLCTVLPIQPARACAFHLYAPEKTAIDWIVETDHLVVARNTAQDPFSYSVVETLREGGRAVEIRQLVDAQARKRFASDPDAAVYFAYDTVTGDWRPLGRNTPRFREIVGRALQDTEAWRAGYTSDRLAIFEAVQDHPDPALRRLALLEFDRAPYEVLRQLTVRIPARDLLAELWSQNGYPYQSIRILLLGLSGDDFARTELRAAIDRAAGRPPTRTLGAFATALIQIDGPEGVIRLEQRLLSDAAQPLDKLEQVVEAMAIHSGVGSDRLKDSIDTTLARLVRARPETAPLVARQFGNRQDWSQLEALQPLVQERRLTSTTDLITVAVYVSQARATLEPTPEKTPEQTPTQKGEKG
ncbi:hypothetical protein LCL97_19805 [Seohaeicola saemankumensis]|nr:hypothetical protein [Seohaeicola saemankumensis]MCA0873082.1 hypothetical protein [Seohaeicola saemankumensis]